MIYSDKYKMAVLPIQRCGTQSLETFLKSKDSFTHRGDTLRHQKGPVPQDYSLVSFYRNPETRLCSWWLRNSKIYEVGACKTFEHFVKDYLMPYVDIPFTETESDSGKVVVLPDGGQVLRQFPKPLSFMLEGMPKPDYVVRFSHYVKDFKNLPCYEQGDDIPHINPTRLDWSKHSFAGSYDLCTQYDGKVN